MAKRSNIKRTAFLSMLCAMSVVVLYLGSIVEVLDISVSAIASLIVAIALIEYGAAAALMLFGGASVLGLILLPTKLPALMYALFFGIYPIIKAKLEKHIYKKWLLWGIKVIFFNLSLLLIYGAAMWVFGIPEEPFALKAAFFALANVTFVVYDVAMSRMIAFYIFKLRNRLKIK